MDVALLHGVFLSSYLRRTGLHVEKVLSRKVSRNWELLFLGRLWYFYFSAQIVIKLLLHV